MAALGGFEYYAWIFSAFSLTSAICVPIVGKLNDIYGAKKIIVFSLIIFTFSTFLCGVSNSMFFFIFSRATQGIGFAGVMGTIWILIASLWAPKDRGKWLGITSAGFTTSGVIGPIIGGVINDLLNWRWIFYLNIPISIIAIIIMLKIFPKQEISKKIKFDYIGAIKFSDFVNVNFDYNLEDNFIQVTSQLVSNETGEFEGRLFILHNGITHQIPIHVRVSDATVNIIEENDELFFEILKPLEWTYAKISAVNKETLEKDSISFSSKSNSPLKIYKSGDYLIEAKISTDENTFDVYDSIKINLLSENEKSVFYYLEEIERPVLILSIITVLVGIFGVRMLRN